MYLFEHEDFEDLLSQTARVNGLPFVFVEKDYWVSYVLFRLRQAGVSDFVFKGGTSLTKGWSLLDRFSEDIDLLFTPHDLSAERKKSRLKKIKKLVSSFDGLVFKETDSHGRSRADSYAYKRVDGHALGPLLPHIKLEMGFRGGSHPSEIREIQSYVGRELHKVGRANLADDTFPFAVPILSIRRTFVEKLFAVHSAFENRLVKNSFRHYYDVFKLLDLSEIRTFLGTAEFDSLKEDVARMSGDFDNTHIPQGLDFAKSKAFKADKELIRTLNEALQEQAGLFFKAPPTGEQIVELMEQTLT